MVAEPDAKIRPDSDASRLHRGPVTAVNETTRGRRTVLLSLTLILLVAAVARFWGLAFGLPHTQARPDETHIIEAARSMLSGRLPRFYDYPWLYISTLSVLYVGYYAWGVATGAFHSLAEMVASWPGTGHRSS